MRLSSDYRMSALVSIPSHGALTLKISKHRLWYVHEWDNMGVRSTFRSRMMRTGLDDGVPAVEDAGRACEENRLSLELRTWSRSLRSSFAAIISAAAALGQRIYSDQH